MSTLGPLVSAGTKINGVGIFYFSTALKKYFAEFILVKLRLASYFALWTYNSETIR